MKRINVFDCPMDISTMGETVDFVRDSVLRGNFVQHVVVNVAKIVNMRNDKELSKSVRACDIINIDGMGVLFALKLLGYDVKERVAGVDLFDELLNMSAQYQLPVYFLGAERLVLEKTVEAVMQKYPELKIAGFQNGYFHDEQAVVEGIRGSGAKLLFVAISSPKKENFINKWGDRLGVSFVMGVGGTFDVVSGKVKRAPKWMQEIGLEWFYRVCQEPKRMWRRYLVTNTKFFFIFLKELLRR